MVASLFVQIKKRADALDLSLCVLSLELLLLGRTAAVRREELVNASKGEDTVWTVPAVFRSDHSCPRRSRRSSRRLAISLYLSN
jgi:hypothetical protein